MAVFVGAWLLTQPAGAQVRVSIAVDPPVAAPATIAVAAVVDAVAPVVGYTWSGIVATPRCEIARCSLRFELASCQRVRLEVTTALGETGTATASVCATDDGARPPGAEIVVHQDGENITLAADWVAGSDPVKLSRLWLDGEEVSSPHRSRLRRGCHAADLMVVDARGRLGFDRRTLCNGDDGPRLSIGAEPSACPIVGSAVTVCSDVQHPLGLTTTKIAGALPAEGCTSEVGPGEPIRREVVVVDARGSTTTASLLMCGAPATAPRTALFARIRTEIEGVAFAPVPVLLELFGGSGLITVEARAAGKTRVFEFEHADRVVFDVDWVPPGDHPLDVWVQDARGLVARAKSTLRCSDPSTAPGEPDPPPSVGCSAVSMGEPPWGLLLLLLAWRRRA